MVDEHLPEILSFYVEELGYTERPIKRYRYHVIPPDVIGHWVVGIAVIAVIDVPKPRFVPQDHDAVDERVRVIQTSPTEKNNIVQVTLFVSLAEKNRRALFLFNWLVSARKSAQDTEYQFQCLIFIKYFGAFSKIILI